MAYALLLQRNNTCWSVGRADGAELVPVDVPDEVLELAFWDRYFAGRDVATHVLTHLLGELLFRD